MVEIVDAFPIKFRRHLAPGRIISVQFGAPRRSEEKKKGKAPGLESRNSLVVSKLENVEKEKSPLRIAVCRNSETRAETMFRGAVWWHE